MKQVTYDFSWEQVLASLINENNIEDGFWQLALGVEHSSSYFASPEKEVIVPGTLSRAVFVRLTKTDLWGPLTVHVENGVILYGPNTDNSGSLPSSESTGEDSGVIGAGISPDPSGTGPIN